ncbi:DUF4825 domain-containing protein [Sporosarcina sp. CAU 1771]
MKLKVSIVLFIVGLLVFSWIQLYYIPEIDAKMEREQVEQLEPETHRFSEVLQYESLYMGSAGNNMNLIQNLPLGDVPRLYQQDPDQFKFIILYEDTVENVGKERVQKAILYNSSAIFTLIKNMEIVEFSFEDETYTVTRKRVNEWFGEDVTTFNKIEKFRGKVQQPIINKEKLTEWFLTYTEGGS